MIYFKKSISVLRVIANTVVFATAIYSLMHSRILVPYTTSMLNIWVSLNTGNDLLVCIQTHVF